MLNKYLKFENGASDQSAQWKTLTQCDNNYCKTILKYISCERFGELDGMDGSCHWCCEMTPYQWHMCHDFSWVSSLMKYPPFGKGYTKQQAIDHIQWIKSGNYKENAASREDDTTK